MGTFEKWGHGPLAPPVPLPLLAVTNYVYDAGPTTYM